MGRALIARAVPSVNACAAEKLQALHLSKTALEMKNPAAAGFYGSREGGPQAARFLPRSSSLSASNDAKDLSENSTPISLACVCAHVIMS